MDHKFDGPVVLIVEFMRHEITTLNRVVEIKDEGGYLKFLGQEKGGQPEVMAIYKGVEVRGWYMASKVTD